MSLRRPKLSTKEVKCLMKKKNLHLEWYQNEGENFCTCHTLAETWAQVYEPKLKWESNK
jgi:hypothetical protein